MISDSDAHILSTVEARLIAAVARQDIMLLEHIKHNLVSRSWWQYLTEEIVRLRWHHPQESDAPELLFEVCPFLQELATSCLIVLLILVVDLHEEFCESI